MAKKDRKLSLKKETLRQLDAEQMKQVAGGNEYYSRVVPPSFTLSCGCDTTTSGCLQNFNTQQFIIKGY